MIKRRKKEPIQMDQATYAALVVAYKEIVKKLDSLDLTARGYADVLIAREVLARMVADAAAQC